MRFSRVLGMLAAILCLSSCATLFQSGPDKIPVDSDPQGAKVRLNGQVVGVTPCVVSVNHKDDADFSVEKDGFVTIHQNRGKIISGWFVADIISLAGAIIDLATYNQGHYPSDPIYIQLQKR